MYKEREISATVLETIWLPVAKLKKKYSAGGKWRWDKKHTVALYIYFILDDKNGAIKIGSSTNVKERLYVLQTATPNKLSIIHKERGTHYRERQLHKKFKEYRLSGEWFRHCEEITKYILGYSLRKWDDDHT